MSNKLARFRVLVAADARFRGGDKRDHSDDSSTDEGPSEAFTRGASAIVTIVPFVPGDGSAGKAKTPLNQEVDTNPTVIGGGTGDKRDHSDNRSVTLDFETRNTGEGKLKSAGGWRYASDPATEILTLTFHLDGGCYLWTPALPYLPLASLAGTALGRLPKRERRVWELDQQINQRGVGIDLDFVRAAKKIADQQFGEAIEEFRNLTNLSPTQVEKVRAWLCENGTELEDLRGETIEETLKIELSPEARRVLEIRSMVASTSLKKLDAILACTGADGRARGLLQYHGATPGRWVGRLLQPQNFPRPSITADPEELVAAVKTGDPEALKRWGDPIETLVSALRHAIAAQGDALLGAGDFETIEARIVLALAGQDDKVALLANGADVYRDATADIFQLDNAQLEMRDNTWGKRPTVTYWAIKDHHWRKVIAWHGHLTENGRAGPRP